MFSLSLSQGGENEQSFLYSNIFYFAHVTNVLNSEIGLEMVII